MKNRNGRNKFVIMEWDKRMGNLKEMLEVGKWVQIAHGSWYQVKAIHYPSIDVGTNRGVLGTIFPWVITDIRDER